MTVGKERYDIFLNASKTKSGVFDEEVDEFLKILNNNDDLMNILKEKLGVFAESAKYGNFSKYFDTMDDLGLGNISYGADVFKRAFSEYLQKEDMELYGISSGKHPGSYGVSISFRPIQF